MTYEAILIERPADGVGVIRINRPQALNALNTQVMREIIAAGEELNADEAIGCLILTGSDKAFAAGADIKEMAGMDGFDLMRAGFTDWTRLTSLGKPLIGAVSGWALGGGSELAMMCDMIVASETAKFGQPEITIGIMTGFGGSQRMTRAIGKALAMEVMLGGRHLTAQEALGAGLVNRVYPVETYFAEAVALAGKIAAMPRISVRLTKDAINQADELALSAGLAYERQSFFLTFNTDDKAEGMQAFVEKRPPQWKHR